MVQVAGYTYDATEPIGQQQVDYDCSAAATAWFGRSIGWGWQEINVLWEFSQAGLISPQWGLLDATGAGIVRWLSLQPIAALNGPMSWQNLLDLAGSRPVIMGGGNWYHWCGVRYALNDDAIALANSARGYRGVYDTLSREAFIDLGPFHSVWLAD